MASRIELNSEQRQNCITSQLKSSETEYGKKQVTRETKKHGDNTNLGRMNEKKTKHRHCTHTQTGKRRVRYGEWPYETKCQICVYAHN